MAQPSPIQTQIPSPPPSPALPLPELLAPAGDWDCARAAVENGADAIYFGLEKFNARMRAQNFTLADLPDLMAFLHERGVRGYVTFNTLIFTDELAAAEEHLRAVIAAGVDAAIVQDIGICTLIRRISPDFPIHASTQMTVSSPAGVAFARELGCNLVVLARECSLREIELIQQGTAAAPLPLEVFVHGALCVAYSGQCLTSEALGGRSANRGECAQACRMPYDVLSDGQPVDLHGRRYLLSPQDLAGVECIPSLTRHGVRSFKIEGRLKSPEYVANITSVYRRAINLAWQEVHGTPTNQFHDLLRSSRYQLEMAFSRGLYTGWLNGIDNQRLVHAEFGKKRGVYLGRVRQIRRDHLLADLQAPASRGDGVVFDHGRPDLKEEGGRLFDIQSSPEGSLLFFGRDHLDLRRIQPGDKIWKTSDPSLDKRLRQSFTAPKPGHRHPLRLKVHGSSGSPLFLTVIDEAGREVRVESSLPLQPARERPLTTETLHNQFGRLGDTPFSLQTLENHLAPDVVLPLSELNRLRRSAIGELIALRRRPLRWSVLPPTAGSHSEAPSAQPPASPEVRWTVLVRNAEQLAALLEASVPHLDSVYCEFEDPKRYRQAVHAVRTSRPQLPVFLAPPRISKPGEEWILRQIQSAEPDGFLVRNYDHLRAFPGSRLIGDFSLNIANPLTAQYFIKQFQLERVTASYDLNARQLESLLRSAPPDWFEITLHQHMPMFHMEHCVFCAFLSTGKDYRDCGRPCDKHTVELKDRVGARHLLKADAGCRNTLFNALAQTGAEHAHHLYAAGARSFRLEFLNESPSLMLDIISRYQQLLAGKLTPEKLWKEFKCLNQLGVTRGQR